MSAKVAVWFFVLVLSVLSMPRAGHAEAERQASPASGPSWPTMRKFTSVDAAWRVVLARRPLVLGVGEYHQKHSSVHVPSSLRRFTRTFARHLARRVSDLVIETWITQGDCGKTEQRVVKEVDKTTERPQQTEDEIVTLVQRARRARVKPHILQMSCADYARLLAGGDGVNYDTFLKMTADQLRKQLLAVAKVRADPVKRAVDDASFGIFAGGNPRGPRDLVVAYGGALHNDRYPVPGIESYSYAPEVARAVAERYVELDLFVPEYIADDRTLLQKQNWFALFFKHQSTKHTLLFERAPNAFVLIFPRQSRR